MKNFRSIYFMFVAITGLLLFTTCNEDDKEPDSLTVSPGSFTFTADDPDEKIAVITTNVSAWVASKSDSWVNLREIGNNLHITAQNHTDTQNPRKATITVSAGNAEPKTITIEQSKKEINSFSVSPTSLSFGANETGDKTVAITTNASSWDATKDASWITLAKQNNTLKVTVTTKNTQTTARTATIKLTAGNAPDMTLTVTQDAATSLSVNPTSLSYEANETGEKTATISTNATSWSATESASWITTSKNGNTLNVNVTSANTGSSARSANITITAGDAATVTLQVTQAAATPVNGIPKSSYTATGTPKELKTPGPTSWSGIVMPITTPSLKSYMISNWGGTGITVILSDNNGKITIDQKVIVANSNDGYAGYFRACFMKGNTLYYLSEDIEYPVTYNKTAKTISFNTKVEGYSVRVGVIALHKTTGEFGGFFTELYENATLKLTTTSSAPQMSNSMTIKSPDLKRFEVKGINAAEFKKMISK